MYGYLDDIQIGLVGTCMLSGLGLKLFTSGETYQHLGVLSSLCLAHVCEVLPYEVVYGLIVRLSRGVVNDSFGKGGCGCGGVVF